MYVCTFTLSHTVDWELRVVKILACPNENEICLYAHTHVYIWALATKQSTRNFRGENIAIYSSLELVTPSLISSFVQCCTLKRGSLVNFIMCMTQGAYGQVPPTLCHACHEELFYQAHSRGAWLRGYPYSIEYTPTSRNISCLSCRVRPLRQRLLMMISVNFKFYWSKVCWLCSTYSTVTRMFSNHPGSHSTNDFWCTQMCSVYTVGALNMYVGALYIEYASTNSTTSIIQAGHQIEIQERHCG